ncbi:MAG: xylulokinase, partial [Ruminiclostridium sp.]
MSTKYLIGVDIGTQGTKTALFSLEGYKISDAFEASRLISESKGEVQQEPDDIFGSVIRTISEVMDKSGICPSEVEAIGIDGQMAGVMGIDKEWNAITYYDSWLDTRCQKYIDLIKGIAEEQVIRITGCPVTYAHGPKILWWKYEKPEVYKRIDKFIMPSTYVVGRLAGLKSSQAYIDYTHLHFSGYGDVERNTWSEELLRLFAVDRNKMPEIVEPWKVVGALTETAAKQCHLVSGIPLVAGCGDSAATSLAAGVTSKGVIFDVAGTASIFSCCVDQYKPDVLNKTLLYPRSVIPGLWAPMAYINGGGLCLQWFKDHLTGADSATYMELDAEAEKLAPGSGGLIFLPHFSGRVCPNNPNVRGSWLGLSWTHKREHLYRAIMEGIAYEYDSYFQIIKSLIKDVEFSQVYAIGGGARSNLFNSIKADVMGINYTTLRINDTAPLGSAIVAGYGAGVYKDLKETVDRLVGFDASIEYDEGRHQAYRKFSKAYE